MTAHAILDCMAGKLTLLKAAFFYPAAMTSVYARHPGLERTSYEHQYETLMADCFHWADFWKSHLEREGRFDVIEIVVNAECLQKAWAAEHGIPFDPARWQEEILAAQVRAYRPHLFFSHGGGSLSRAFRLKLKAGFPAMRCIDYDGIALTDLEHFKGTDAVLSCLQPVVSYYRGQGLPSHHFKLGFEESILGRLRPTPPRHEVTFVGGISLMKNGHGKRLEFLSRVAQQLPLALHIQGPSDWQYWRSVAGKMARGRLREAVDAALREYPLLWRLNRSAQAPLYGLSMYQHLHDSKITLNFHIDAAGTRAANFRLFEATGAGTCLVTDFKEDLKDYFAVDREVVAFRSLDDCLEKVRYLLDHDSERKSVAERGQQRTLRDHRLDRSILEAGNFLREVAQP